MIAHLGLTSGDIDTIVALCFVFGGGIIAAVAEWHHEAVRQYRKAARARHRRKVELAYARAGLPAPGKEKEGEKAVANGDVLPAAAAATPPGARPVTAVPGQCRHERIIPVITNDGELRRWVCANWPRCAAQFPASIALYESTEEDTL